MKERSGGLTPLFYYEEDSANRIKVILEEVSQKADRCSEIDFILVLLSSPCYIWIDNFSRKVNKLSRVPIF